MSSYIFNNNNIQANNIHTGDNNYYLGSQDSKDAGKSFSEDEIRCMRLAIEEEKKSIPENGKLTPKVGASIMKGNKILGTAFRGQKGTGDHAEYTLFEKVLLGADVTDASLFTTLEPCTHRGKNKPCTNWVIEKGIKHIYIGLLALILKFIIMDVKS